MHAGIAFLHCACLDRMSDFLTYDWSQLHAAIARPASLACDWVTACWDILSVLCMQG